MLLLFLGWIILSIFLSLLIGSAIHEGDRSLSDAPEHVQNRHWERITERHQPHAMWRRSK